MIKGIMGGNFIMPKRKAKTGVKRPMITPDHIPTYPAEISNMPFTKVPVISCGARKDWNITVRARRMAVLVMNRTDMLYTPFQYVIIFLFYFTIPAFP